MERRAGVRGDFGGTVRAAAAGRGGGRCPPAGCCRRSTGARECAELGSLALTQGCGPGTAFLKLENTPPPPFPSRPLSPPRPRDVSWAPAPPPASGQREAGTGGHRRAPAAVRPPVPPGARRPPSPSASPPAGSPQPAGAGCLGGQAARRVSEVKEGRRGGREGRKRGGKKKKKKRGSLAC